VTVRVVERSDPEMLLAAFEGNLGVLSHSKHPRSSGLSIPPSVSHRSMRRTPTASDAILSTLETPGFYLHRERFQGGVGRAGRTVLVIAQGVSAYQHSTVVAGT
jgi:hypothetical protein